MAGQYNKKNERFGMTPDQNKNFTTLGKDMDQVNLDLDQYRSDVGNQIDVAVKSLTSSSSNADIVTALKDVASRIKALAK